MDDELACSGEHVHREKGEIGDWRLEMGGLGDGEFGFFSGIDAHRATLHAIGLARVGTLPPLVGSGELPENLARVPELRVVNHPELRTSRYKIVIFSNRWQDESDLQRARPDGTLGFPVATTRGGVIVTVASGWHGVARPFEFSHEPNCLSRISHTFAELLRISWKPGITATTAKTVCVAAPKIDFAPKQGGHPAHHRGDWMWARRPRSLSVRNAG